MKVFVTKYALTQGIFTADVRRSNSDDKYVYGIGSFYNQYILGKTAFHSWEDAEKNAKDQRIKKIANLKKQIERLEKMIFTNPRDED